MSRLSFDPEQEHCHHEDMLANIYALVANTPATFFTDEHRDLILEWCNS